MKKRLAAAFAASLVLMCGCTDKGGLEEGSETAASESITVTFAETEPTETEPPQTETPELKENQLEFRSMDLAVLMEFTGAEPLNYYPKAVKLAEYREDDYVLHAVFTVENLTYKSFDFIPQKMLLHGRDHGSSYTMLPITENDTGLIASDGYYTIEPDECVSFKIDFVGDKECVKCADRISYYPDLHFYTNNIDADGLNNVSVASPLEIEDRITVKNAVRKALEITENKPLPFRFVPSDGDHQVNTEKNSYCFTVEKVRPNGKSYMPLCRSFDEALVQSPKIDKEITVNGESVTLYDYPSELYLRSDGTAEYDMYFSCEQGEDYDGFIYEGENDSFDERIEIE